MLHVACPLTPAATELFQHCLEISADLVQPDAFGDEWGMAYPLSASCLTSEQARATLLDLLEKLRLPQVYVPTTYHWLLMYECLDFQFECINDDPLPSLVESLKASANEQDTLYLHLPRNSPGEMDFSIDFIAFVDLYFWDTDFLLDPSIFYQMDAPIKQSLGYRADLFSVLSGLAPHPTELILKRVDEFERPAAEREDTDCPT